MNQSSPQGLPEGVRRYDERLDWFIAKGISNQNLYQQIFTLENKKAQKLSHAFCDLCSFIEFLLFPGVIDVLHIVIIFQHINQFIHVFNVIFVGQSGIVIGNFGYISF